LPRCHQRRDGSILSKRAENDGSLRRGEKFSFLFSKKNKFFRRIEICRHESEGFVPPPFMMPQSFESRLVSRIAGEMKASEPLDGLQASLLKYLYSNIQGPIFHEGNASGVRAVKKRAAIRACHGLGVIAPVSRIVVFFRAEGTERKGIHGCVGAIVGKASDNRKSRTAIGAVRKRIGIPGIAGSSQISSAIFTRSDIRRNEALSPVLGIARKNGKSFGKRSLRHLFLKKEFLLFNFRQGRGFSGKLLHIVLYIFSRTEKVNFHTSSCIADAAGKVQSVRENFAKRAESHSLNDPGNSIMSMMHRESSP